MTANRVRHPDHRRLRVSTRADLPIRPPASSRTRSVRLNDRMLGKATDALAERELA
jgi:hypothetical protein